MAKIIVGKSKWVSKSEKLYHCILVFMLAVEGPFCALVVLCRTPDSGR
jgi:hypothetical protein